VKLLLVPASYPHPGAPWIGAFNEHSALALRMIVERVEVLVPRPYAPRVLANAGRWRSHALTPARQRQGDITVHRPAYPVLPWVLPSSAWTRTVFSRPCARRLHRAIGFDAILSFDLAAAGCIAWRLGRALGIPACGWATGSDIRHDPRGPVGRSVRETLQNLDLVFYQSAELKSLGAALLGTRPELLAADRHVVQPRGVREPASLPGDDVRRALRAALGVAEDAVVILYLGRIARDKGVFELVDGFARFAVGATDLALVLVGSRPGHDDSPELERRLRSHAGLGHRIRLLPGCEPGLIWNYFRAADVFAFPSFREGMPNSLLEAMLAGLPAVAFSIPPVREISRFGEALVEVPAYDFAAFGDALLKLAADRARRREIGERAREIVRAHFSVDSAMRVVVSHIERLVARSAGSTAR
jgi:glycosyltransferase involved in cell wall biosynthesis